LGWVIVGRPSKYQPEFAEQALKLCRLGATDKELADFFQVDLGELALWAWESREFFDAITPSDETRAKWDIEKREAREQINAKRRARRAADPEQRLLNAMRARLWAAIKGRTDGRLFGRLGYSKEELVSHLESRFQPGMTWGNYGRWHVDHKRPCASFDLMDVKQFAQCWALDNLQPLWAGDNLKKSAKFASS
jgi:hypothetical protein